RRGRGRGRRRRSRPGGPGGSCSSPRSGGGGGGGVGVGVGPAGNLVGDPQQQGQDHEVGHQRGSAVGHERHRDAGQRDEPGDPAQDDERLDPEDRGQPGGQQLEEGLLRPQGDAEADADEQQVDEQDGGGPDEAELFADGGVDEVGGGVGDLPRAAEPEAGAGEAPRAEGEEGLDQLVAVAVGRRPGVAPGRDPLPDVAEGVVGQRRPGDEEGGADAEVAGPGRGDVEHGQKDGKEQQRRAEVGRPDHDQDGAAPGQEQRVEVRGVGEHDRADPPRRGREQLPLLHQVGGEEDHQQDLGRLAGLEVERPEVDPQPGAVDVLADSRDGREEQRGDPEEGERVAVALQVGDPADGGQGGDEGGDADRRPQRLVTGQVGVEPGDDDEADAVEEDGEAEEGAVGPGGEAPYGQVGDERQPGGTGGEGGEVGREPGPLGQGGEDVAAGGEDHRQRHQAEFGGAPGGG